MRARLVNGWPWLRTQEATAVINRLWEEDLEEQRRKQRNDDIYADAIRTWFRRTEPVTPSRPRQ